MRRLANITLAGCCLLVVFFSSNSFAQQGKGSRPIVAKVMPIYPELARPMKLEGTVKVSVVVEPNGNPKSVQGTGGHPLLLKAAQDAVSKWRWAPANQQTTEYVELRFHP